MKELLDMWQGGKPGARICSFVRNVESARSLLRLCSLLKVGSGLAPDHDKDDNDDNDDNNDYDDNLLNNENHIQNMMMVMVVNVT